MTSPTDEITHLRRGLEDIRDWCQNVGTNSSSIDERAACQHLAAMARRALKTPRASKVVEPTPSPRWDDGGGSGGFGH